MSTNAGNIWSDTAGKNISISGHHQGVLIDGKVYDNIHTNGVDLNTWINDFFSPNGIGVNR